MNDKTLPDNVKRIDIIRIERNREKLCTCEKPIYEIDTNNKLVYCTCGAIVDPYEALYNLAYKFQRMNDEVENLLKQRKEIANYKPYLVSIKRLEHNARSQNMIPVCPRCNEAFELNELVSWMNRNFAKGVKDNE